MSDDALSGIDAGLNRHLSDEQLNAFLDDQLAPDERALASAHLGACTTCQESLDQLLVLSTTLGNLAQHPVPRSFQLTPEMAGSGQSFWQRLTSFLVPMLPAMRTATMVLVLALGGITLARITQDDRDNSSAPESAMVITQTNTPANTIAAGSENPTQQDQTAPETEQIQIDPGPTTTGATGSDDEDRDIDVATSDEEDSFSQDDTTGAGDMSDGSETDDTAASDVAMESAPMAADDEEPLDQAGESASDVSMMKAPEGTPATPAASPSPIEASPSPVVSASPITEATTGIPIDDDDFEWPWTAIQVLLAGLIGLLGIAMVVGSRSRRSIGG